MNDLEALFGEMKNDIKALFKEMRDISDKVIQINSKLDAFNTVQTMVYSHDKQIGELQIKFTNSKEKVEKIDGTLVWVWRSFGGAIIAAIVGLILLL
ncbi:MAG: hypothetical protein ACOYJ1_10610 [Peptococcales bacterium]